MEENQNMSVSELAKYYEEETKKHEESIKDINNVDELEKLEQEIIKEQDELGETLKDKLYKLPSKLVWGEKEITRNQIGSRIRNILDNLTVEYSYTLGYYQIACWWAKPEKEISYAMLDSTLRVLGNNIQFKGIKEWENILIINEYFKSNNDEYTKDLLKTMFIANKHNNIVNKLQMIKPVNSEE